ncbi:MAG TPA: hypothetical protein PKC67_06180 [Kiritimatiellia bacterium]|nr:hypothetical protein [Kiritimatiellia bacterium]HMP33923.1 hypothetical protein [Kiritimatiellia bacterium]
MMKGLHRLLGVVLVAAAVGASLYILLPAFQGGAAWTDFLTALGDRRAMVIVGAVLVVLAATVYLISGLSGTPRAAYLTYETEHGNISISLKALQEFLGHLRGDFPAILQLSPKVRVLDESLDVTLAVRVRAGAPIPEICRMLQERARALIQEKIGVAAIRDVEVKVEEIIKNDEAKPLEITPKPPPAGEVP